MPPPAAALRAMFAASARLRAGAADNAQARRSFCRRRRDARRRRVAAPCAATCAASDNAACFAAIRALMRDDFRSISSPGRMPRQRPPRRRDTRGAPARRAGVTFLQIIFDAIFTAFRIYAALFDYFHAISFHVPFRWLSMLIFDFTPFSRRDADYCLIIDFR
jgi:hypothetical protein